MPWGNQAHKPQPLSLQQQLERSLCSKCPGQFLSKLQIANPGNQKSLDILAIFLNSIFYLSPWRVSKNSIGNLPKSERVLCSLNFVTLLDYSTKLFLSPSNCALNLYLFGQELCELYLSVLSMGQIPQIIFLRRNE